MIKKIFALMATVLVFVQCSIPTLEDVIPPVVTVIYPYENAVISDQVNVEIAALDAEKVSKVWFYVNGIKVNESTTAPYSLPLPITGLDKKVDHVLMAAAEDENGNIGYSAPVTFIVAETADIIPPTVAIVNPVGGQVVEGIVNITAYAEDERSIQKVYFYIDGILSDSSSAYPYMSNWNTDGISDSTSHTIFAKAVDGGNNEAVSAVVNVTVYPRTGEAGDNTAPAALFLYPIAGSTISGTVDVSLDLFDNVGVSRIELYVDGQQETAANNPTSPWTYSWDTSAKADTLQHSLYAKVSDAAGNVGTSGLMVLTIQ